MGGGYQSAGNGGGEGGMCCHKKIWIWMISAFQCLVGLGIVVLGFLLIDGLPSSILPQSVYSGPVMNIAVGGVMLLAALIASIGLFTSEDSQFVAMIVFLVCQAVIILMLLTAVVIWILNESDVGDLIMGAVLQIVGIVTACIGCCVGIMRVVYDPYKEDYSLEFTSF